jgi:hypothetical protein
VRGLHEGVVHVAADIGRAVEEPAAPDGDQVAARNLPVVGREGRGAMIHRLKIAPEFFAAVASGTKPFEVREDDRGFTYGDVVQFQSWTADGGYDGRVTEKVITYILDYDHFPQGLQSGYCVLGLKGR